MEHSESLLQSLKQEHSNKILVRLAPHIVSLGIFSTNPKPVAPMVRFCVLQMGIKQLSELQGQLQKLKEENKNAEVKLLMEQGLSREKVGFEF